MAVTTFLRITQVCGQEFVKPQIYNQEGRQITEEPYINTVIRTVDSETCMLNFFNKMLFYEGVGEWFKGF